jgi:hypothetical protein
VECWIDVTHESDRYVIRLAGRLGGAQVPDLSLACRNAAGGQLFLDLSDLLNADAIGIETLRRLRREGAILIGASQYIRLKLDSTA